MRSHASGTPLNRLATRISRFALSLPPCTRDTVVCVPSALRITCSLLSNITFDSGSALRMNSLLRSLT
jgi:hypothetical protein